MNEPTTYPHGHGDLAEGEPVSYSHGHTQPAAPRAPERARNDPVAPLVAFLAREVLDTLAEVQADFRLGLCGVIWAGGPNGEPLACAFPPNPPNAPMHEHSWAWVPTVAALDATSQPAPDLDKTGDELP